MTTEASPGTLSGWDRLPMAWRTLLQYAAAAAAVVVGLGLRLALTAWVGPGLPTYVTFYPAVMAVALLGGLGPGLLATALSALTAAYLLLAPVGFTVASPVDRVGSVLFLCMGLFMSLVAEFYRAGRRRAGAVERELALRESLEALRAAAERERFLAGIVESSSQAFGVGYPDGRLGMVNRAFEELTGYSVDELRATDWARVLTPPEWVAVETAKLQELHDTGLPVRYEKEYQRKDGTRVPIELLVHLVRDGEGHPQYYYSFIADIAERKRAEEQVRRTAAELADRFADLQAANAEIAQSRRAALNLVADTVEARRLADESNAELRREVAERQQAEEEVRRSELRLRTILDALPVAVFLSDPRGNVVFTNAAVQRIWGLSAHVSREEYGQYQGRWLKDGTPVLPEQWALARVLDTGEPFVNDPVELAGDGGAGTIVHNFALPIRGDAGQLLGVVVVTEDVTERTRSQEQVRQAKEAAERAAIELARSNEDLEQFAYVASHDLQEPLRAVAGFMAILRRQYEGQLDADAQEYIGHAIEGAERMQALINDLLTFSRVGSRGGAFAPMDLQDALDDALGNLQVAIEETGAAVTHDALPTVVADPSQMTQLLQNLIANAVKFRGPRAPAIHVGARHEEGRWVVTVADNGIGIEPQYYERIFLIFQRLHARTRYAGTGIGLAVCKKIADRHGGSIWVDSRPGEGTAFHFAIPDRGENA